MTASRSTDAPQRHVTKPLAQTVVGEGSRRVAHRIAGKSRPVEFRIRVS